MFTVTLIFIYFTYVYIKLSNIKPRMLMFGTLLILYIMGTGYIQHALSQYLMPYNIGIQYLPTQENSIILLAAGFNTPDEKSKPSPTEWGLARIFAAASEYSTCKKVSNLCKIIISGGNINGSIWNESVIYSEYLSKVGVPSYDIILESGSRNTWENAKNTTHVLHTIKSDNAVLVTSSVHLKRAMMYFAANKIFLKGVASDFGTPTPSLFPNSFNYFVFDVIVHEYIGIVRFHLYNLFGLNK